jgi:histidinol-phosphate/aromatic aminotransferase/cobyric acid decarboxylase-like protein
VLDLSVSLNPFAPDVRKVVASHLDDLHTYPDPADATTSLAEAIGVSADRLLLTNGGSEAIALVAAVDGGGVAREPEFSLHPRNPAGPRWRSNPHSPTGRLAAPHDRAEVWDEAFYPLATGAWTRGDAGAVVVGSLTKVLSCPGLRLGYVLADDVERYRRVQPHWAVNSLALAAVPDLLAEVDLPAWAAALRQRRSELADVIRSHGHPVEAADAPWVIVEAPGLRNRLAQRAVVVRDCSSFGLPDHVRIGLPDEAGLVRLDTALREVAT